MKRWVLLCLAACEHGSPAPPPPPPTPAVAPRPAPAPAPQPIELATQQTAPTKIVVTATDILWLDEGGNMGVEAIGKLMRLPKSGGAPVELASKLAVPLALAIDGATVFVATRGITDGPAAGGVWSVPIAGGTPTKLALPRPEPTALALDGNTVYFAERTAIAKVGKHGGKVTVVHGHDHSPGGVAIDATHLYWTSGGSCVSENGAPMPADGAIYAMELPGGAPKVLASGLRCPEDLVLDDDAVYAPIMDDGTIVRVPKAGGALTVVATDDAHGPRYLAVDADAIYWANQGTGKIHRRAKSGGPITTLAQVKDPAGIAVDDAFVYFTDADLGVVEKVAK